MIRVFPLLAAYNNCGPYGMRGASMHYGVDLCAPTGTTIVAVDDGTVSYGSDPLGGNVAILHAQDGNAYFHAHMLEPQSGSRSVTAGTPIGRVDMTGNAFGTVPHLHFEWWPSGSFQRPAPDPTAQLLAALAAPGESTVTTSNLGLAIVGGVVILGAAGLAAWAINENKHHAAAFGRENPTTASRCPVGSNVQSLLFPKSRYTPAQAKRWATAHGYKSGKMDVSGKYIHLTQAPSSKFARIRTVPFGRGIVSRVGWTRC